MAALVTRAELEGVKLRGDSRGAVEMMSAALRSHIDHSKAERAAFQNRFEKRSESVGTGDNSGSRA